jgi:ribose transport system permease protein
MNQVINTLKQNRVLGAVLIAVALHLLGTILINGYSSPFSIRAMLVLASLLAVASIGQTLVIILGGIDLSIPFVIGFANVVAAQLTGQGLPFALVCTIVAVLALAIGAVNGALSSILKIHPLIVTLGIGTIVQGLVLIWTKGFPSGSAPDFVSSFVSIGGSIGPIPVPGIVPAMLVLSVIIIVVLARTVYGRRLYAQGGNPTAAPFALINPVSIWITTFALSALFAATAGVLLLGFTGSAYGDVGQPYLFQTIAAAVVLTEINTLLIGLGLQPSMVQAALGAIIILLVSIYGREPHLRSTV